MSWAEEQSWFGLGDVALDYYERENYIEEITIRIPVWRTKDDRLIPIRSMSTSHIINCIKMIKRSNNTWRSQYLVLLENELGRRSR